MTESQSVPKVSIAIPVYNGERWIRKTIESILEQTFRDFELIISDNNSSDNTVAICQEFMQLDKRIRLHENQSNIGAALNFNRAFELSRGTYFKWASSNDLIAPNLLEKCVEVLDTHRDVVMACSKTQIINANNEVVELCEEDMHLYQEDPFERFTAYLDRVRLNNLEQGLMRAEVLRKTSLQGVYPNSDTVLMSEMAARGKVFQIPEFLMSRRIAESATTNLMTPEELAHFYTPEKTHIAHRDLKRFAAFFSIATRLSLPFSTRMKFYLYSLKNLYWSRVQNYESPCPQSAKPDTTEREA